MATEIKLSPQEYAQAQDPRCPLCLSPDVQGEEVDIGGRGASQNMFCQACGAYWLAEYRLIGYGFLESGVEEGEEK